MGGIVMTNDGNCILREITVQHPAAKTMIEIARTQDEEVRFFYSLSCEWVKLNLILASDFCDGLYKKQKNSFMLPMLETDGQIAWVVVNHSVGPRFESQW